MCTSAFYRYVHVIIVMTALNNNNYNLYSIDIIITSSKNYSY